MARGGATSTSDELSVRCSVWGVLNVTPDSFSDGGDYLKVESAIQRGLAMIEAGADIIDVGGESTRPAGSVYGDGFERVTAEEEVRRVLPVVEGLVARGQVRVSIDTTKAEVARAALEAGACIVNDVSGGRSAHLLDVTAAAGAELVLMHNRHDGQTDTHNTGYGQVVPEVIAELMGSVERAEAQGVSRDRIWLDPGIGFAKNAEQSVTLLAHTASFVDTGFRVLVGPSRKSFIATLATPPGSPRPGPEERVGGTAAAVTMAVLAGAHGVRVHDVRVMTQAVRIAEAGRSR